MAISKDLTVGEPSKVLRSFCLPMLGSILFQQLYNLADSFVAGKLIGEEALAAVGNSYEITLIFLAFAFGCNIGCSVTVSQLFGGRKLGEMKTAVSTSLIMSGAVCLFLMTAGFLTGETLLRVIQTPENILPDSLLYLNIYILGLPFVFFYNVSTGIFSALGDSKTPFIFLAVSSTANIGADILFVAAFGMGVDGVAWATFICQGISCLLALFFVMKRLKLFTTDEKPKIFSARLLKKIASVAVPSTLQQGFISVGNILIQGVINGFGSGVIAGYAASVKLNNLVITSLTTLGNGVSNYTAQNMGAGKAELQSGAEIVSRRCDTRGCALFLRGRTADAAVYGRADRRGIAGGGIVPAHRYAVLHRCFSEACRGRGASRCGTYGEIYGGDLHRPDTARYTRVRAVRPVRLGRDMGGMACGLDCRDRDVRSVLSEALRGEKTLRHIMIRKQENTP